jgi:glycosyltransferase involved in cell wall biosynthesis
MLDAQPDFTPEIEARTVGLRILQVSTYDVIGGAARSAYRLHRGLIERGHDCRMLVAKNTTGDPTVDVLVPRRDLVSRVRRRLRQRRLNRELRTYRATRPSWPERFSDDRSWWDWRDTARFQSLDVINLQWIAGFVDYREFFQAVPPRVPVVWTLRDMNIFTGGCHYDAGCERFTERCGACPQLGSTREDDLSRGVWRRKRDAFESLDERRLHIVTPSRWMAGEVRRSSLLGDRFAVSVIPNGVNTDEFAPRDRAAARSILGIPQEALVVLFVAYSVAPRRKGFALLIEALRRLEDVPNLFLLSVGSGTPPRDLPLPQLHLGNVAQNRFLSTAYSAADLYVIPSLQDNLPSTVLEAMACGTPVVGFDTGGVAEMVQPGRTGALSPVEDVSALAGNMERLLADPEGRAQMAEHSRQRVLEEFSMELYVRRYEELYERLTRPRADQVSGSDDSGRQVRGQSR